MKPPCCAIIRCPTTTSSRSGCGAGDTTGLNQGEAHHALKNALRIGRQGESRDRSSEGQHYRLAGLNLLVAIVIYWNTAHLGEAVGHRKHAGLTVEPELPAHISPLGWAHILLTGEYRWPKRRWRH